MHAMQKIIAGSVLAFAVAGCVSPVENPPASANGRYLFSHDSRDVYITDTATGTVWYRTLAPRDEKWTPLGSPVTQPSR